MGAPFIGQARIQAPVNQVPNQLARIAGTIQQNRTRSQQGDQFDTLQGFREDQAAAQQQNALARIAQGDRGIGLQEQRLALAQEAAQRDAAMDPLRRAQLQANIDLATARAGTAGQPDAPSGFRFTQSGDLEAIPGGPATRISAEVAGRMGLAQTAMDGLDTAFDRFENANTADFINSQVSRGEIGRAERKIGAAVEAGLRLLTGAAAPEAEVNRNKAMFMPNVTDTTETIQQKKRMLSEFMQNAAQVAARGRGGLEGFGNEAPNEEITFTPDGGAAGGVRFRIID